MASLVKRPRGDGTTAYLVVYKIRDPDTGRNRQGGLTFDTEKTAQAFKAAVEAHGAARALEMYNVDPAPRRHRTSEITVAEWCRRHIDDLTGVEQSTLDSYERYLRLDIEPFFGHIPLTALKAEDIGRWVKHMETTPSPKTGKPLSPKSIKNKHGFLSGALGAAVIKGEIPSNPAAGRRLPRITGDSDEFREDGDLRMLSVEEFDALLAATTEPWRPFVEFLVAAGCRWGEATALRPDDVNRTAGTVRIRRAVKYSSKGYTIGKTKTKRSDRMINVPKSVLDKLDYSHEWLFVNRAGRQVRYQGFRRRVWDKAVARAKLDPPPTPHALRHTCGSWMLNAGVPIMTVSRHLGHESIKVTADIYGHVDRTSHQAAADVMGKILAP
ncbi:integrase [Mycobacterium sp. 1245499.0]|uniref:tyrosine-type recombinase/integrase n=1 Tax=Mycobacterium sp. 1245499.0 TaxID=1834074 RepID=UPI0007FE56CC|nr:site-specific integrase [Mycobacterium sp. 1245499.0]OBK92606.1 integrase [Mycobacterium sp. 1245499.0]